MNLISGIFSSHQQAEFYSNPFGCDKVSIEENENDDTSIQDNEISVFKGLLIFLSMVFIAILISWGFFELMEWYYEI